MHRREALPALAELGPQAKSAIPALTKLLTDSEREFRLLVAATIAKINPQSTAALPPVAELAHDPQYQFLAIETLGKMGPIAIPTLMKLAKEQDESRRGYAVVALGHIGPDAKTAVPVLAELLACQSWTLRWAAAESLAQIGPAAIPSLKQSLKSDDPTFRRAVAEVLWRVSPKDETAIPVLFELLKDDEGEFRLPAAERERMAAFLSDGKGKPASDCPAWAEYRKVVGDTPVTRQLFGRMLAAEPELCAALGGDPGHVADLLALRAAELNNTDSVRRGRYSAGLPNIAAIFLAAASPDVASRFGNDLTIQHAVHTALQYGRVDPPIQRYSTSSHFQIGTDWQHPTAEQAQSNALCAAGRCATPIPSGSRFAWTWRRDSHRKTPCNRW